MEWNCKIKSHPFFYLFVSFWGTKTVLFLSLYLHSCYWRKWSGSRITKESFTHIWVQYQLNCLWDVKVLFSLIPSRTSYTGNEMESRWKRWFNVLYESNWLSLWCFKWITVSLVYHKDIYNEFPQIMKHRFKLYKRTTRVITYTVKLNVASWRISSLSVLNLSSKNERRYPDKNLRPKYATLSNATIFPAFPCRPLDVLQERCFPSSSLMTLMKKEMTKHSVPSDSSGNKHTSSRFIRGTSEWN